MRFLRVAVITLVPLLVAPVWAGQGPPPEGSTAPAPRVERKVTLRDGSQVAGQVLEWTPGQRIVLQLSTGETRTMEWAEVALIEAVSPALPSPPIPAAPLAASDEVSVQLRTDQPISLAVRESSASEERRVYSNLQSGAIRLAPLTRYIVSGDGIPNASFKLGVSPYADVAIATGSRAKQGGGIALTAAGGLGVGAGAGILIYVGLGSLVAALLGSKVEGVGPYLEAAGVAAGVGIPCVVGGVLLIISGRTRVTIADGRHGAPSR